MEKRYIASVSGGKDSTALYLWCIEQFGAAGFEAVFADTGHEHPVTVNYVKRIHEMAGGPAVSIVSADFHLRLQKRGLEPSGVPFLDLVKWKGRWASATAQYCTQELKLHPIKEWIERTDDGRDVTTLCGVRAGESKRRSLLPERGFGDFYGCDTWRPLISWSEEDVWEMLKRHGVPPNPLYAAGYSRVGCFPCIHARKSELAILPDWAWEKLAEWERITGRTFFSVDKTPGPEINFADHVRTWAKTTRGGLQLDMFPVDEQDVPHCMATWGSCE